MFEIISRLRTSPEDAQRVQARLAALRPPPAAPGPASGGAGWVPDDWVFAGLGASPLRYPCSGSGRPDFGPLSSGWPASGPPAPGSSDSGLSDFGPPASGWLASGPPASGSSVSDPPAPRSSGSPASGSSGVPRHPIGPQPPLPDPAPEPWPRDRSAGGSAQPLPSALRTALLRLLPESLVGARTDPGRRGAVSLLAVATAAAVLVAVMTWRSRPAPVPVQPPPLASLATPVDGAPAGPPASAPLSAPAVLVVAVTGKVRRPGVVKLPGGSRVVDAVRAAGGALPSADVSQLNLARRLVDGELVAVGIAVPAGPEGVPAGTGVAGQAAPAAGAPVDLNSATAEQLDTLPGVGPVLAQRILEWRAAHGRFDRVDQLRDVDGIGESKFAQLRDRVTV